MISPKELDLLEVKAPKKKRKGESVGLSGMGALLRKGKQDNQKSGYESRRFNESAQVLSTTEAEVGSGKEGPIAKVVLISEGIGNMRDKNYYGPEAIQSAPTMFEGKPMLLDHPSYSEERDLPERSVKDTVGYYKNLSVQTLPNGRLACVGECHFDLSVEGQNAFQKCRTAAHYSQEFPNSDQEYIGISINAEGESEPRKMTVEGQEMDVNYVMRFVGARSADLVTIPARGGKIVATVESIAGARLQHKEVRMKTVQKLQESQKLLKAAEEKATDPTQRKTLSEAREKIETLLKEILESATRRAKGKKAKESEDESEDESESNPDNLAAESEDEAEDESESEDEAESEDEGDDDGDGDNGGDSHTTVTHKIVKKTGKAAMAGESARAHRLAVRQLVQESKLNPSYFDLKELESMKLAECEREIARTKRMHEAMGKEIIKRYGDGMGAIVTSRESADNNGQRRESTADNNADFADLSVA